VHAYWMAPGHTVVCLQKQEPKNMETLVMQSKCMQVVFHEVTHAIHMLLYPAPLTHFSCLPEDVAEFPAVMAEVVASKPTVIQECSYLHINERTPVPKQLLNVALAQRDAYFFAKMAQNCNIFLHLYGMLTEEDLDDFASGKRDWSAYLRELWHSYHPILYGSQSARNIGGSEARGGQGSDAASAMFSSAAQISPLCDTKIGNFWMGQHWQLPYVLCHVNALKYLEAKDYELEKVGLEISKKFLEREFPPTRTLGSMKHYLNGELIPLGMVNPHAPKGAAPGRRKPCELPAHPFPFPRSSKEFFASLDRGLVRNYR